MLLTFHFNGDGPGLIRSGLDLDYSNYAPGAENTQNTSRRSEACRLFNVPIGLSGRPFRGTLRRESLN